MAIANPTAVTLHDSPNQQGMYILIPNSHYMPLLKYYIQDLLKEQQYMILKDLQHVL